MAEHVEMNGLDNNSSTRPLLQPPRAAVVRPVKKRHRVSDCPQKPLDRPESPSIMYRHGKFEEVTENVPKDSKEIEKTMDRKSDGNLEDKMAEKLKNGDLDDIKTWITPKKLTNCATNCLEKSLEVSHRLRSQADTKGPDADDLNELASSVEEFAFQLLEPLKSDDWKRTIFEGKDFDRILDKAVKYRQKKFVSHPVIHDILMTKRWTGYFAGQSWFKWFVLNIWTFFDVFLFPLVHGLLWMIHLIIEFPKKRQELCIVFLFYLPWVEDSQLTKITATYEREIKYDRIETITGVKRKKFSECLKEAEAVFRGDETRKEVKKVLVVMTDNRFEDPPSELQKAAESLKRQNVKVIYIGIYRFDDVGFVEYPDFKKLETLASDEENVVLIYNADSKTDEKRKSIILECIKGKDIYERYVQYFKTPYFIFVRDTVSYLVLLGLHFAMCLQSSTIHFTPVEWIISVFFLGRFMIEIYQLIMENNSDWDVNNEEERGEKYTATKHEVEEKQDNQDKNHKKKNELKKLKLRGIISGYFDDWWNKLDVIILIVYLILVGLRVFIWSQHFSVSKSRLLAVAGYLYGLNAMFLTLRVFGNILEYKQSTGSIQIALFHVIGAVVTIFGQFLAATVAFSLAITKIHLVEVSYNSGKNNTSTGLCGSQNRLDCWWSFTRHLVWSLFGITELAPLESSNYIPDTLARILYGLFLMMSVVMLMNMMIALLSNTYQQVEDNAFHEWSYKKATTIRTYNKYHPVPVPFNIISLSYILLRNIYRTFNGTKENVPLKNDMQHEKTRKKNNTVFEKLVGDLKDEYFAKNGYVFPISDKKRTELVFKETKGNRDMNEWITGRVFLYNQQEMQRLKSHGDPGWDAVKHVNTSGQRLELSSCDCEDVFCLHGARYCVPLSEEFPKFEVLIQETGEKRAIAIGVVPEYHKLKHVPGWFGNSAGYLIDEGRILDSKADPDSGRDADDAMAFKGDIIGCEILYGKKETNKLDISFTLNGRVVGEAEVDPSTGDEFYPFVGIGCKGISLVFRICPKDTLLPEDTVLQMLNTISEQQTKLLSNKPSPETDSVLQMLNSISEQQQMTRDRLTDLERKIDHLSKSEL